MGVPEGNDRRELYKSQYRAIYTYKMSAQDLDQAFREAVTDKDAPDGNWSIKNDERVKYVGKLEVTKGEDQTLRVRRCSSVAACHPHLQPSATLICSSLRALHAQCTHQRNTYATPTQQQRNNNATTTQHHHQKSSLALPLSDCQPVLTRACSTQVTMEDYPEAGMSALKYYPIQSYTK